MKDRLRLLRKELGLTQREFSERIGIKPNTFSQYESGRNEPIDAVLRLICETFNVNEEWLRTGSGTMFVQRDPFDEVYKMVNEMLWDESSELKRRLVTAILRLSPAQLRYAREWIMETFDLEPAAANPDPEEREPTIDEKVAAYRAELEAEEASKKSQASQTTDGSGKGKEA